MDVTTFAGISFTDIFYRGMRMMFYDENRHPGLLYRGNVHQKAVEIIAKNGGKRVGFSAFDEQNMLHAGNFKYDGTTQSATGGQLIFEGPDKDDLSKPQYMETTQVPQTFNIVEVHFYNIVRDAANGTGSFAKNRLPQNDAGVADLALFMGALVLHEIMHHHGFHHVGIINTAAGSDYASSLPVVAWNAAMNAGKDELGFLSWWALSQVIPPLCSIST